MDSNKNADALLFRLLTDSYVVDTFPSAYITTLMKCLHSVSRLLQTWLGQIKWRVSTPSQEFQSPSSQKCVETWVLRENALKLLFTVNKSIKQLFAWILVPSLQFSGPPHFKIQPLGPTIEVGTFTVSQQTSVQEMQDFCSVVYLLTLGKGHRHQVTSIPRQKKVCQCEEGKARFMGLETSRRRTARLPFWMTVGKRHVMVFLRPFKLMG